MSILTILAIILMRIYIFSIRNSKMLGPNIKIRAFTACNQHIYRVLQTEASHSYGPHKQSGGVSNDSSGHVTHEAQVQRSPKNSNNSSSDSTRICSNYSYVHVRQQADQQHSTDADNFRNQYEVSFYACDNLNQSYQRENPSQFLSAFSIFAKSQASFHDAFLKSTKLHISFGTYN